jgi:hypothetical protein
MILIIVLRIDPSFLEVTIIKEMIS